MKSELYKAIKAIEIDKLTEDDLSELLKIFTATKNSLIRDHIASIFSDLHFDRAAPYIIKKAGEKDVIGNNGALISSLYDLDVKKYFLSFIRMIGEYDYEARLMAYELVLKYATLIQKSVKKSAIRVLQEYIVKEQHSKNEKDENSRLHFLEKTLELLQSV